MVSIFMCKRVTVVGVCVFEAPRIHIFGYTTLKDEIEDRDGKLVKMVLLIAIHIVMPMCKHCFIYA